MKLGKSKLALAKVINENGGWPERALWAVQDNCIAFFLGGKPEYKSGDRCWYSNSIDGACVGTITRDEKVTNWHQTVLSREEYYQAYPKADADGWIEVTQSGCPVNEDDVIQVRFRYDDGSGMTPDVASNYIWDFDGSDIDVVSYRPHKQGDKYDTGDGEQNPVIKPEFCESVMRSIPEPEEKPTIEQLALYYRNKLDYAIRKQQEADDSKAAADAALGEIKRAGEALGLLIGIAKHEHELVITDWRDLRVGDEVECTKYDSEHRFGVVCRIDVSSEEQPIMVDHGDGRGVSWPSCWKFIRRP